MPPSIHIVRHAQSMTNVSLDFDHHDPELTELGHQQSTALAEQFKKLGKIDLVLASPMQRTIQTALNAFPDYNNKIVLIPDLQEYGATPSDTGSSPDILLEKYGDTRLDYSFVTPDWTDKGPHTRYAPRFVAIRARSARIFIRSIAQRFRDTDANIVVVSHATFIGFLTKGDENLFLNAEYRTYYFDPIVGGDIETNLIETPCSITRRGELAPKPITEIQGVFGPNVPIPGGVWHTPEPAHVSSGVGSPDTACQMTPKSESNPLPNLNSGVNFVDSWLDGLKTPEASSKNTP